MLRIANNKDEIYSSFLVRIEVNSRWKEMHRTVEGNISSEYDQGFDLTGPELDRFRFFLENEESNRIDLKVTRHNVK